MTGKVLRIVTLGAALAGGCATRPETPRVSTPPLAPVAAQPAPQPAPLLATGPDRTRAKAAARPTPGPTKAAQSVPAATRTMVVSRAGTNPERPVPLFRQAIVLANVRAAVADLPDPPQAEFRRGLLTLTFRATAPDRVTQAVTRAMTVQEVERVQIVIAP